MSQERVLPLTVASIIADSTLLLYRRSLSLLHRATHYRSSRLRTISYNLIRQSDKLAKLLAELDEQDPPGVFKHGDPVCESLRI